MRIEADRDSLLKAIGIVDSLIPSRSVNAILANCLFNVTKNEIEIVSTDNEIGIKTTLEALADSEILFTVNGTRLSSLLKELPSGVIVMDINENYRIDIKTKAGLKGEYALVGTSGDEYPLVAGFENKGAVEINQIELKNMIRKVVYAAATDTIKPFFNGVYFISESKDNLTLVATDSRRLSGITRNLKNEINLTDGVIIPLKAVHELHKLLSLNMPCLFSVKNSQCFFKIGNTEFVTRTVDHKFPNYKQVIPGDQDNLLTVSRAKLIETLRRAMIFTKEPANTIICKFRKDILTIEVKSSELGECVEDADAESNIKEDVHIGLNAQFFYEAVKEMESETVKIWITGQMNPVKIVPDNDENHVTVIMPIRIKTGDSE